MLKIVVYFAAALMLGGAARADITALLDTSRPPYLSAEGRADYARFLLQPTPRAFALAPDGAWGWAAAIEDDPAATEARAVENCARWGGQGCRIYARDLAVVWPGLEARAPAAPAGPITGGPGWMLAPDGRFLWQGPERARGAYVWAHGRSPGGADSRGSQPQPHVRAFNNAGYDVIRFDRDPATDETEAGAAWMRDALRELRRRGYARVVVGGQSRGAWNALQALDTPGLADAVIAIAPAAHGPRGSPAHAWALDDLRRIVAQARNTGARVAVANFAGDEFDPDPDQRAAILGALTGRVAGFLMLDRPRGIQGHGGGADWRFTLRYAPCLLDFAEGRARGC
ncbi:alpha/beta hydrolase family protein [Falsiroseomonas oryziterrae]|uniref:alpha/beta hydrolase family protein n=1 Tax=Falsiroseomonas oryziterrae TaxID=2911368 RepID=UPI001F186DD9|nr:alpha/beta hydrolase [Roseomonas sp. NPKOSM-4]